MEIYYSNRKNAKYEQLVLHQLILQYDTSTFYDKLWHPNKLFLSIPVNKAKLIDTINKCQTLTILKSKKVINAIGKPSIPDDIYVATVPEAISFDFAVIQNNDPVQLICVHEKQHRTFSISRPSFLYNKWGHPCEVPRFIQRLVRDIWRFQVTQFYGINYVIIWDDWLVSNKSFPI